jgi:hypothetical protein
VLLSQLSAFFSLYYLIRSITFIGNENLSHIWICMLVNLFEPVLDVIECLLHCAVVH